MFHGHFHAFRPRHPLARLVSGVIGVVVVLALIALGTFAIAALAIGGVVLLLVNALRSKQRGPVPTAANPASPPSPGVIEGEFTVVHGAPTTRGTSDDTSRRSA